MRLGLAVEALPLAVRNFIDKRREPRVELDPATNQALLIRRLGSEVVSLGNISPGGAMFLYATAPNLGERVILEMADGKRRDAQVMWVRGGEAGLRFE